METIKQKIIPHLRYNNDAKEAAEFYTSIFPASKIVNIDISHDSQAGDLHKVSFELWGEKFIAADAGPDFKFTPAISFMVNFDPLFFESSPSQEEAAIKKLDEIWEKLSEGGMVMMPVGEYPFSKRYGWIQDKYGLSWQLILTNPAGEARPPIISSLLFVGESCGHAEEALNYYLSIFKNSKQGNIVRYMAGQEPNKEGTIMFSDFMLENYWFSAMESAYDHKFTFNETKSFLVICDDPKEIDYYRENLYADSKYMQNGWFKDKFGISWQVISSDILRF